VSSVGWHDCANGACSVADMINVSLPIAREISLRPSSRQKMLPRWLLQ
jgi:hypothetical protein